MARDIGKQDLGTNTNRKGWEILGHCCVSETNSFTWAGGIFAFSLTSTFCVFFIALTLLFLVQCHAVFQFHSVFHLLGDGGATAGLQLANVSLAETPQCRPTVMIFSVWKCVTVMGTCTEIHFSIWLICGPLFPLHHGLCWPFCKCLKSTLLHSLF